MKIRKVRVGIKDLKAITPKRLALLHAIRTEKLSSMRQLSEISGRDVSADIKFLYQVGLVDIKKR